MLKVEDWAEIRRLARGEQMPIKAIARQLGISKNTVLTGALVLAIGVALRAAG